MNVVLRDASMMFNTHLRQCPEFGAGDETRLRELLHPAKASLALGYSLAHGFLDPGKQFLMASSEIVGGILFHRRPGRDEGRG